MVLCVQTCYLYYFTLTGAWLDFTYTITIMAPDSMWGEYENGSWNGLLGEVHHGEKDLTTNYFTLTEERLQHFDGSVPYNREGFGFALRAPAPFPAWQNLIFPFTWQVI